MTLDLLTVGPQVGRMGRALAERAGRYPARLARAREVLLERAADWQALGAVAAESKRRLATPLERLDARHALPRLPRDHRVIATDGSQIEPDRHGMADYYLLNVGWAAIAYGSRPSAELASEPRLYFEPDELYIVEGDRRVPVQDQHLSAKRSGEELRKAATLAAERVEDDLPTVVLADGTLLLWVLEDRPGDFLRLALLRPYIEALDEIRALGAPLASYVSRPRYAEVSGLLREATCRGDVRQCPPCASAGDDGCALDGLPDRELFRDLRPGERSARFSVTLSGSLLDYYRGHVPQFFYLDVGSELARVELPPWTGDDPERLALVHAVVFDQCRRGLGYPVVLARAHEQALVSMGDRLTFQYLLDGVLARQGVAARLSEKQISKNRRAV
ncbi:MAG: DNA double-strand break repair nuclease NurA [Chloroflexi bacterium]|nr:DNA double-strand break repair nuclease NurA [Chloroflexota bacterium]